MKRKKFNRDKIHQKNKKSEVKEYNEGNKRLVKNFNSRFNHSAESMFSNRWLEQQKEQRIKVYQVILCNVLGIIKWNYTYIYSLMYIF